MKYLYYAKTKRAIEKNTNISDTFNKMRDFYSEANYEILRDEKTFEDVEILLSFWDDINTRNKKFSTQVLKKLYVLSYSPYGIWNYVVSLYFMSNRDLDEEKFCAFLDRTTAMILMNGVLDLGKQNIRRPFVMEFKDIFRGEPLNFDVQFKPPEKILRSRLREMKFSSGRAVLTRAMLAWWTFRDAAQELPPLNMRLEIEHIYAKNRCNFYPLNNPDALEFLGNKTLLEKRINIGAADYHFADKKKYYFGWQPPGKGKKISARHVQSGVAPPCRRARRLHRTRHPWAQRRNFRRVRWVSARAEAVDLIVDNFAGGLYNSAR